MVIGHKSDMTHERVISFGDGERFASANGLSFLETSASKSCFSLLTLFMMTYHDNKALWQHSFRN